MTNLGFPSVLARTCCGQRFRASVASDGFSATCPSASMICMTCSRWAVLYAACTTDGVIVPETVAKQGRTVGQAGLSAACPCNTAVMAYSIARPKLEGNVAVGDDRQLGFAEFGDPQGRAIFWLHGTPGAQRPIPAEARVYAADNHIRLIGIDRPGIGSSTPYQYENVLAFADDLRTVADTLGVDKMTVIGLSGGGPYTLACAAAMPDRVIAVGVLGGVAPTTGPEAMSGGL